jgi:hypothetical protein
MVVNAVGVGVYSSKGEPGKALKGLDVARSKEGRK